MIPIQGMLPARWPSDEKALQHSDYFFIQYGLLFDPKTTLRIYYNSHQDVVHFLSVMTPHLIYHKICHVVDGPSKKFALLHSLGGDQFRTVDESFWSRSDWDEHIVNALVRAKKDHSGSTLARQALKHHCRDGNTLTENDADLFKIFFGSALKTLRQNLHDPARPFFLRHWIDERGPPGEEQKAWIYELPKPLTAKQYATVRNKEPAI